MSNGVQATNVSSVQGGYPRMVGGEEVATVQKGEDTLGKVAKRLNIPEADLREANPGINPKKITQGQDIHYPKDLLVQKGEKTLEKVADRMGIPLPDLQKANQHIKNQNNLQEGQAIRLPDDFLKYDPRSVGAKKAPEIKKGGDEKPSIGASEDGITAKHPKGGKVNVSPGGDVKYTPPKIGPVQPEITGEGVGPKLPQSPGDRIKNPKDATRKSDDWKNLDPDKQKKLDEEQKKPGRDITDREIRKGIDKANNPNQSIDREFELRQAQERIRNPIPKKTLRMRDE